jgi:hypothetical protein
VACRFLQLGYALIGAVRLLAAQEDIKCTCEDQRRQRQCDTQFDETEAARASRL